MAVTREVSRRAFLAATGAGPVLWSMVQASRGSLEAAQRKPVPVGIELYAVRDALGKDMLGTLTAVAKMGYQLVEFYSPYLQWTTDQAKEARKRLDDLGITCRSTHNGANAFSGDTLKKAVELNQILGSTTIVMASPPPKLVDVAGWRALGAQMTEAVGTLRPLGMTAGFHNHQAEWRLVEGQRPMDILAATTPREFVLQFDVGTAVEAGADPVAWVKANPGRIKSMHLKDWGAGEGRGYNVAFGEGDVKWIDLFSAGESVGGVEYYLIEQEHPGTIGELAMAQKCLDNYRKLRA
jgi:sugar phosphate isomerase/epimerase